MTGPPRITPFRRGLRDEFFGWLRAGTGRRLIDAFKELDLDVRFRDDYLNAYEAQNSVAKLRWKTGGGVDLEIHTKFLRDSPLARRPNLNPEHDPYARFDVTREFASAYLDALPAIQELVAAEYAKGEGEWEAKCVKANRWGTPVLVIDRQIVSGKPAARIDILAIGGGHSDSYMVAVEMKRDLDSSIQKVSEQTAKYLRMLDPDGAGLREDVADSYRDVCHQLRVLGFEAPDPDRIRTGMPVKGLVVLADYNDKSELLQKAFDLALGLDREIGFCRISKDDLILPPEKGWSRPQPR